MTQLQQRADLASRGELERRLADVEASHQALLEHLPGVVYTLGPEAPNQVVYISPQIEVLLGKPAADWIGDSDIWKRLVHPDDADWVAAECERTNQTGEPFTAEYRMQTRDGEVRWVRDEAVLVHGGDGHPLFWQGSLTDITASRLTAARLAEALDHEHDAAQQLAEALEREQDTARQLAAALEREQAGAEHQAAVDEMKTISLQAVSHDLRSPLTTILGIALTLERGGAGGLPADEVADLLHRLSTNARKLDGLLGDLLDLDRLARGTLTPHRQPIDLGGLVRRVVQDAGVNDEHAVVVEDEGPGVPAQLRERIFQPFHKGRNIADHPPGSGIGLALVAQFASLHGGRAWVQDRPGGGASFRVFLPDVHDSDAATSPSLLPRE